MLPGCGSSNFGTLAIVILESEEGKKYLDQLFLIIINFQALNQLEDLMVTKILVYISKFHTVS